MTCAPTRPRTVWAVESSKGSAEADNDGACVGESHVGRAGVRSLEIGDQHTSLFFSFFPGKCVCRFAADTTVTYTREGAKVVGYVVVMFSKRRRPCCAGLKHWKLTSWPISAACRAPMAPAAPDMHRLCDPHTCKPTEPRITRRRSTLQARFGAWPHSSLKNSRGAHRTSLAAPVVRFRNVHELTRQPHAAPYAQALHTTSAAPRQQSPQRTRARQLVSSTITAAAHASRPKFVVTASPAGAAAAAAAGQRAQRQPCTCAAGRSTRLCVEQQHGTSSHHGAGRPGGHRHTHHQVRACMPACCGRPSDPARSGEPAGRQQRRRPAWRTRPAAAAGPSGRAGALRAAHVSLRPAHRLHALLSLIAAHGSH
jgi:hypothetical protein